MIINITKEIYKEFVENAHEDFRNCYEGTYELGFAICALGMTADWRVTDYDVDIFETDDLSDFGLTEITKLVRKWAEDHVEIPQEVDHVDIVLEALITDDEGSYAFLTEDFGVIQNVTDELVDKTAKFLEESVEWLKVSNGGCCSMPLPGGAGACVGWSCGYDPDDEDIIHAEDDGAYVIVAGLKNLTSDDLRTDYDWIDYFTEGGECIDVDVALRVDENKMSYRAIARYILSVYAVVEIKA